MELPKIKSGSILQNDYPAAFALKHLVKDLRLAKEAGLNTPLMRPLCDTYNKAQREGLGEEDVMAVIKYLQKH